MRAYVTADTHAFHGRADILKERGFTDAYVMTEFMANAINSVVLAKDTLYHLGDFAFGGLDNAVRFREMLNCRKVVLIAGNHDFRLRRHKEFLRLFHEVYDLLEIKSCGLPVVLCHYPIESWARKKRGSVHLHGHSHGNCRRIPRRKDVGVDCEPVPLPVDEVVKALSLENDGVIE